MQQSHPSDTNKLPWGPWKSLGLTALILMSQILISILCIIGFIAYFKIVSSDFSSLNFLKEIESNNLIVFFTTGISAPVMVWLVVKFASMKKGFPVAEYLGLKKVNYRQLGVWLLGTFIYLIASSLILASLGVQDSKFMENMGKTDTLTFIVFAIVVVTVVPLSEEFIFRGFLYSGFLYSREGVAGAIIIPSLIWAIIHLQYEPVYIASIFFIGIILGFARYKTQSIWIPIAMHSLMNLIASVAVYAG